MKKTYETEINNSSMELSDKLTNMTSQEKYGIVLNFGMGISPSEIEALEECQVTKEDNKAGYINPEEFQAFIKCLAEAEIEEVLRFKIGSDRAIEGKGELDGGESR